MSDETPTPRSLDAILETALAPYADAEPEKLLEATNAAISAAGGLLARTLMSTSPEMLAHYRRQNAAFHGRLRRTWGRALNSFLAAQYLAHEISNKVLSERPPSPGADALAADVLMDLHAQALRVALECHALLDSGLPVGAHARSRTLLELAVTAVVIAEHCAETDIAERYRAHGCIDRARDAAEYERNASYLGDAPLEQSQLLTIRRDRDMAIEKYGKAFDSPYGWAAELVGKPRVSFTDVASLAGLSHLRSYYLWSCHSVHAGSRGAALNRILFRGEAVRLAGRTNGGLADPAQHALWSLHMVTTVLLTRRTSQPSVEDLVELKALGLLVDQACALFLAAHHRLEARERRVMSSRET